MSLSSSKFRLRLAAGVSSGLAFFRSRLEAQRLLADAPADDLFQTDEGPAADEQDVGGIHGSEFLVGMLAAALRRHIGNRAFEDLQQRLLHAFAGNIAGDGRVLILASDLVHFVDVDDAGLGASHIAVGGLQQLEDDVLDVLADVTGFGQGGGVHDGEGNIEHAGQGLGQQGLAGSGGADQHDVRLGQFDAVAGALAIHVDALVVVVNRHRQLLLGLLLADHVLVEEAFHFLRLGQLIGGGGGRRRGAVVFQDGIADRHALVANVGPGIIAGG